MPILGAYMVPHPPLIVKEIGGSQIKQIEKTLNSYQEIAKEIATLKPDTIVISSPHTYMYNNHFYIMPGKEAIGSFEKFGHPEVKFTEEIDEELSKLIINKANETNIPVYNDNEPNILDHGTMVPLYFIEQVYKDFKIVLLGISGLSYLEHYRLGQRIKEAGEKLNRKIVYIASGDLSHKLQKYGPYGFVEEGPIYDTKIMDIMGNARFLDLLTMSPDLEEKASVCGHRSFVIMAGLLDKLELETKKYSHEDVTGVGYGICSYKPMSYNEERGFLNEYMSNIIKDDKKEDPYIKLAKETIKEYIINGRKKDRSEIDRSLQKQRAGTFVTLYKFGKLRGCIGTIIPTTRNVGEEIIMNAISSATMDPRFNPVTKEELDDLEIHVDVLSPLEEVKSIDELDEKKYGILVSCNFRKGVLLPNIESVNSVADQISIALRKGNISPDEDYKIEKFTVTRHE